MVFCYPQISLDCLFSIPWPQAHAEMPAVPGQVPSRSGCPASARCRLCCLPNAAAAVLLPLCLFWSLLGPNSSTKRLGCHPTSILSLWCFVAHHWEFSAESSVPLHTSDSSAVRDRRFYSPPLSRVGSVFHPLHVTVRLQFTVCGFQFCWGSVCTGAVLDYFPWWAIG
jgi:hypothetical protein